MLQGQQKPVFVKVSTNRVKTSDYSSNDNSSLEDIIRNSDNRNYYKEQIGDLGNSLPEARFSSTMHTSTTTISKGGTTAGKTNTDAGNTLITKATVTKVMSRGALRDNGVATSTPITTKAKEHANTNATANDPLGFSMHRESNRFFEQHSLDTESIQNHINSRKEHRNVSNGTSRILSGFSSNDSSVSFDASRHLAYLEYKQFGEYWKKTPKTDYTYSKFSKHRRILAPGVVAMPNMSRNGLAKHTDRVDGMIERNPGGEDFIRKRYMCQSSDNHQHQGHQLISENFGIARQGNKHNTGFLQKISPKSVYNRLLCFLCMLLPDKFNANNSVGMYVYDDTAMASQRQMQTDAQTNCVRAGGLFGRIQSFFANEIVQTAFWSILLLIVLMLTFISLASIKDVLLGLWPLSISFRGSNHTDAANIPKFLSDNDYEQLLLHLNTYVDKVLHAKFQEVEHQQHKFNNAFVSKQSQLIIDLIKENLKKLNSQHKDISSVQLRPEDLSKLAHEVYLELQKQEIAQNSVKLSNEQIQQVQELIAGFLNRPNNAGAAAAVTSNEILDQIFNSGKFQNFLNEQFIERLKAEQGRLIADLSKEVSVLKTTVTADNKNAQKQIDNLLSGHEKLLREIEQNDKKIHQRFANIMLEIAKKMESMQSEQFSLLNNQVKLILLEILGYQQQSKDSKAPQLTDFNLSEWLHNIFVAKTYLEEQLSALNNQTSQRIRQEVDRSSVLLMRDISTRLKEELLQTLINQKQHNLSDESNQGGLQLSEKRVHDIVKAVLAVYDADKTGLVDFALESAGGQILSTRCTENYQTKSAQLSIFGIPLWYPSNTPRVAISPSVHPGECWAFQSFPGFLVLKLNSIIYVTGFTLEHIPKSLTPNGRIDSAPRNFTVLGLEHEKDHDPIIFGEYEYIDNNASLQYFPVLNDNIKRPYEIVELRIESNHGHPLYTCLYRFRVHGIAAADTVTFAP